MKPFTCTHCRHPVFFENSACVHCGLTLGFVPRRRRMVAFAPATSQAWRPVGRGAGRQVLRPCANRVEHAACNWMVDDEAAGHRLCPSCRLNDTIPDLSVPGHLDRWIAVERAKRRLVHGLASLGLAPQPKRDAGDPAGLAFRVLAPVDGRPVLTGHAGGVITLDLMEADDVHREATRVSFGEPWRTLLGHLRHEAAHYLHHRWIAGQPALEAPWREAFGDERDDYAGALQRYHDEGPAPDWATRCISAYASAHPHEDWAETCAHLMLIVDAVETADAWGLRLASRASSAEPAADALSDGRIDELLLAHWLPVARFVNAMNRSIGLPDAYPFQLPDAVLHKMRVAARCLRLHASAAP